ncbi:fibronectin type III domain-containing protein, partial [Actinoplanes philippinensis]|uniref:fibronectin type III domain-containing protein n=1 Tax=Actinoplanes philippinensis TaxID=35752 RepID=UPI003494DF59
MSLIRTGYRRPTAYLVVLILLGVFGVTAEAMAAGSGVAAPTRFTAVAGNGTVTLTWTRASGAVSVDVIRNGTVFAKQVTGTRWTTETVRNGVTYKYALRSVDAKGRRSGKSATRTVTPQAPPPALNGVAVRNQNGQVALTWQKPNNTIAATVRARVDGAVRGTAKVGDQVLTIGGLTNDKSYLISLEALNKNGSAGKSVQVTGIPSEEEQRSPFGLTATGGAARVDLSWNPVAGAQRYHVYRNGEMLSTVAAPAVTAADVNLTNTVTYKYQVRVVVSGQLSGPSPIKVATPLAVPATPGPVTAQPRDGAVLLSWPEPDDPVAAYEVYRNNAKVAEVPGTALTYTDSGLVNKKTYQYQLVAYNANKSAGPRSAVVSAVPGPAPGAPAAPAVIAGDSKVTLSWTGGGTGRWVLLRDGNALGGVLTGTGFVDTSAINDITYRYALVAVGADQQWSPPSTAVAATPRAIPPNAPAGLRAVAGNTEVTLTWDMPLPAAARYRVYRDGARVAEVAASPARDGALDNDTTYEYRVTALDARGVESAPSATVLARPTPPAEDVPTVTATGLHEAAQLTFTPAQGRTVAQWRVLRDGVEIARTALPASTDRQLTDGRTYRYQVQSVYDDGTVSPLSVVAVAAPRAPWQSVSVGSAFTCAVHVNGTARCWAVQAGGQDLLVGVSIGIAGDVTDPVEVL